MKTFKWTVEFEVTNTWVEDGFNLTQEKIFFLDAVSINNKIAFGSKDRSF